jgi:hypothetical protein
LYCNVVQLGGGPTFRKISFFGVETELAYFAFCPAYSSTMKTEAIRSSEASGCLLTTQHSNPENNILYSQHSENLNTNVIMRICEPHAQPPVCLPSPPSVSLGAVIR